jgi:hypothetical protein
MEDDLKNGRQSKQKWKTTLKKMEEDLKNGRQPKKKEDNLNKNGRRP